MSIQLTTVNGTGSSYVQLDEELGQTVNPPSATATHDLAIDILETTSHQNIVEGKPSRCKRIINWFSESGDPKRPPRWKRFTLLTITCAAAVASRIVTTDTLIVNAASLLSAVQVNAEIYDLSFRYKLLFLISITGISTLGELAIFPGSSLLQSAKLSGLCWALAIRTFSVDSQKWININAAQNK